jgi:hypothetical protein
MLCYRFEYLAFLLLFPFLFFFALFESNRPVLTHIFIHDFLPRFVVLKVVKKVCGFGVVFSGLAFLFFYNKKDS